MNASDGRVVYEVNVQVDASIADACHDWLNGHVQQMLGLPGFVSARMHQVLEPAPADGQAAWCVHYLLRDTAALDDYLREHAPRLRADGVTRFGNRFRTSRRVMREVPIHTGATKRM